MKERVREKRESAFGYWAEKAQGGQTRRQKQRPRQWQQLPDHMIADRCQGAAEEGCMQIRQSTAQSKNVKGEREDRETVRGYSMEDRHGNIQKTKKKKRKKRAERTVSVDTADSTRPRPSSGPIRLRGWCQQPQLFYI